MRHTGNQEHPTGWGTEKLKFSPSDAFAKEGVNAQYRKYGKC